MMFFFFKEINIKYCEVCCAVLLVSSFLIFYRIRNPFDHWMKTS